MLLWSKTKVYVIVSVRTDHTPGHWLYAECVHTFSTIIDTIIVFDMKGYHQCREHFEGT